MDANALKAELPAYLVAAAHAAINVTNVEDFSDGVLEWWRQNNKSLPAWYSSSPCCLCDYSEFCLVRACLFFASCNV
eukprot:scaffold203150_cov30-Tisochrysis_lutea.AAC.1